MPLLRRTNSLLDKWIFLLMPALIFIGILSGQGLAVLSSNITPYLFMLLTFISTLKADYRSFGSVFRKPVQFCLFLVVIQLFLPWLVWRAAEAVFVTEPDLAIGITICVLLPMGVTSIFWVSYNKGNMESIVAFVTLNTFLSPFIVPASFAVVLSSHISLDSGSLMMSLVKLVLIPAGLGLAVGERLRRNKVSNGFETGSALSSKACLFAIVLLNAAAISGQLDVLGEHIVKLMIAIFLVMVLGYMASYALSTWFSPERGTQIAISYAGGVRNYTVGVVLAAAYFSPIVGIPVLLAMLLQHPLAMLFVYFFRIVFYGIDSRSRSLSTKKEPSR
ncbi:bile acid:sodium symporter family protein [Cohnella mopanensis]|uniref:bile acid:sodium symporter family protein n=1 Tax=Cohnella mopanensis TaxID=2911966 RepID=UPI001EF99DEE|nr:hypothetical protein [Cohnella mopanensis]